MELLFDLTFVVAVGAVAAELAHALETDHVAAGVRGFLMLFFAIWWAWVNFTWFASAYDTDDVPYRLLTLVIMAGVLVLTAGVSAAFEEGRFGLIVTGYVIMRLAMVIQWLRAAAGDDVHRRNARRYAAGIGAVQVLWVSWLLVPEPVAPWLFVPLAAAEMLVPIWAERGDQTPWHPHHIAERYGLFTIIVLGECVFAATAAVRSASGETGWSLGLVLVFASALVTLFTLWWLYFGAAQTVQIRQERSFVWGYGHYFLFAAAAALGAGVEAVVVGLEDEVEASTTTLALGVAVPVALFIVMVWALHTPVGMSARWGVWSAPTAVAVIAVAMTAELGVELSRVVALIAVPPVLLLVWVLVDDARHRDPRLDPEPRTP